MRTTSMLPARSLVICALLASHQVPCALAGPIGTPRGPVVAELFTSQGCNSCPPAEALLGELATRKDVLPLAFHVTYWNDLGWRDRFSFADADARQYRYAQTLGKRGVYTPQMIVNGEHDVLGSNRNSVLSVTAAAPRPQLIRLSSSAHALQVELPALSEVRDCDLLLLGVQPSTQTAVGRGENAGRLIHEFNVVRGIYARSAWDGKAATRSLPFTRLPADASLLVLLAQRRADGRIVAVGTTSTAQQSRNKTVIDEPSAPAKLRDLKQ